MSIPREVNIDPGPNLPFTIMSETVVTIQLATLGRFTSEDLIRNGLHLFCETTNLPAELVNLLRMTSRVRR